MQIKAKKSLGQNFLNDKNIIEKIVDSGNISQNDIIFEVGPGTGNLTECILNKNPKKIYAIEKDTNLANILQEKFKDKVEVINEDILKFNENNIEKKKLIVFGNLPYNISTQILAKWIKINNENLWYKNLILMFQKEVANRIIAEVSSKNYSRLSILSNWKMEIKKLFDISPNCFVPKPKVESTVLLFTPKKKFFKIKNSSSLETVTKIFFNQRRKMIKNPLRQLFKKPELIIKKLKLDANLRPQNLSPRTYFQITKEFENLKN